MLVTSLDLYICLLTIFLFNEEYIRRYKCRATDSYVPEFSRISVQDKSGVHPQMRLAASERSFNESYPRSFSRSCPDTCVNLIYAGTSDEFPPEVTRRGGEKSARMRYRVANNSRDA